MADKEQVKFLRFEDLADQSRKHVDEFDPADDAFERNPIPQPGWKHVRLGWQEKEEGVIQEVTDKETGEFKGYMLYLSCTVVDGDEKGLMYNVYLSTTLRKGKNTGEIATILAKKGVLKQKGKISHEMLVRKFGEMVNKGLILWNEVDWRGSRRKADGKYEDVLRGAREFERDKKTGKYKESVYVTKGGETFEVTAQIQSRNWSVTEPELKKDDSEMDMGGEEMLDEGIPATTEKKAEKKGGAKPLVVAEDELMDNDGEEEGLLE